MNSAKSSTMQIAEPLCSTSTSSTSNVSGEDINKLENELLYGSHDEEDCDDEEEEEDDGGLSSDDSMKLRVSSDDDDDDNGGGGGGDGDQTAAKSPLPPPPPPPPLGSNSKQDNETGSHFRTSDNNSNDFTADVTEIDINFSDVDDINIFDRKLPQFNSIEQAEICLNRDKEQIIINDSDSDVENHIVCSIKLISNHKYYNEFYNYGPMRKPNTAINDNITKNNNNQTGFNIDKNVSAISNASSKMDDIPVQNNISSTDDEQDNTVEKTLGNIEPQATEEVSASGTNPSSDDAKPSSTPEPASAPASTPPSPSPPPPTTDKTKLSSDEDKTQLSTDQETPDEVVEQVADGKETKADDDNGGVDARKTPLEVEDVSSETSGAEIGGLSSSISMSSSSSIPSTLSLVTSEIEVDFEVKNDTIKVEEPDQSTGENEKEIVAVVADNSKELLVNEEKTEIDLLCSEDSLGKVTGDSSDNNENVADLENNKNYHPSDSVSEVSVDKKLNDKESEIVEVNSVNVATTEDLAQKSISKSLERSTNINDNSNHNNEDDDDDDDDDDDNNKIDADDDVIINVDNKIENTKTNIVNKDTNTIDLNLNKNIINNNINNNSKIDIVLKNDVQKNNKDIVEAMKVDEQVELNATRKRRRRKRKSSTDLVYTNTNSSVGNQGQEKENVRQKRETAQKAEEIIRNNCSKYLNNNINIDSDSETSNDSNSINGKANSSNSKNSSPVNLPFKRASERNNSSNNNGNSNNVKRAKKDNGSNPLKIDESNSNEVKKMEHLRKFFLRDCKEKLSKLTQEELEELLIQKVIETITQRDEMGKLREQAKICERNQEATRARCQQLTKQIKDFEMVLKRLDSERVTNSDATPIKINRSVGLQVNFISDHGMQSLRQLQQNTKFNVANTSTTSVTAISTMQSMVIATGTATTASTMTLPTASATIATTPVSSAATTTNPTPGFQSAVASKQSESSETQRKGLKTRSPRRNDNTPATVSVTLPSTIAALTKQQVANTMTNPVHHVTLVNNKPVDNRPLTVTQQIMNNLQLPNSNITFNGVTPNNTMKRQAKILNHNNNNTSSNNDNLIDLTDEEDKSKRSDVPPLTAIAVIPSAKDNSTTSTNKIQRLSRAILNTSTGNVITPNHIRLVPATSSASTVTQNNSSSTPTLKFMVPASAANGAGQPRQLLVTSNPNQARGANNIRPTYLNTVPISYQGGIPTLSNGVRIMPVASSIGSATVSGTTTTVASTAANNVSPSVQRPKNPPPLPGIVCHPINLAQKLPPPAPSLKIHKVLTGIVLSWNMNLNDQYAKIASYQLYAYQEMPNITPNSSLWKKVGDVRALPLPMACTLTQFSEGNNYYFAVRAVDEHSRVGQYSLPGNISI